MAGHSRGKLKNLILSARLIYRWRTSEPSPLLPAILLLPFLVSLFITSPSLHQLLLCFSPSLLLLLRRPEEVTS